MTGGGRSVVSSNARDRGTRSVVVVEPPWSWVPNDSTVEAISTRATLGLMLTESVTGADDLREDAILT